MTEQKHPGGRPTDYRPEYCEFVAELFNQGKSIAQIARVLRVAKSTIYEWQETHPEFSDAIKKGKDWSEGWWEDAGQQNLYNKDFSYTGWYMNMKNRHGWADRQEVKTETTNKEDIDKDRDLVQKCKTE